MYLVHKTYPLHLRTLCLVALLIGMVSGYMKAQTTYRSAELKRLVTALQLNADSIREGVNLYTIHDRPVKVTQANRQVVAVGYQLFHDAMIAVANTPIMGFLERYFLQMDYPKADRPRDRMMREDRFRVEAGSLAAARTIRIDDEFAYACERHRYVATWSRDGQTLLSVSFPAEHELISGENKVESENNVQADILNASIGSATPVSEQMLTSTVQKNYFVRQGGTYLNNRLSADVYYERRDSSFVLIADESHPLETTANMMLCAESPATCVLKVKQVMYGYQKKYYEVPLRNWIAYCQNNGCQLYYGVESFTQNGVRASVIAVNEAEGYNHVLFVNMPLSVALTATGTIEAQLETFIPMHNVRNLFAKYQKNKNKQPKTYSE